MDLKLITCAYRSIDNSSNNLKLTHSVREFVYAWVKQTLHCVQSKHYYHTWQHVAPHQVHCLSATVAVSPSHSNSSDLFCLMSLSNLDWMIPCITPTTSGLEQQHLQKRQVLQTHIWGDGRVILHLKYAWVLNKPLMCTCLLFFRPVNSTNSLIFTRPNII